MVLTVLRSLMVVGATLAVTVVATAAAVGVGDGVPVDVAVGVGDRDAVAAGPSCRSRGAVLRPAWR